MAKVTIANLNTLLDDVVTSNIAVQDAQYAVTNAAVQAGHASTSAQAAAATKTLVDNQLVLIEEFANAINDDVQENEILKDVILGLEAAIAISESAIELTKDNIAVMLSEVITSKSDIDIKAELVNEWVADFHTKYIGASLEAPNASWDGMELATGMIYYDIAKNSLMIYINTNIWVPIIEAVNMLIATNNLADLLDKPLARTNLGVLSVAEVEANIQADIAAIKGKPLGLAELDANGLVPAGQLPSYVDDVLEVATKADLPVIGETGKIYVVIADETSNGDTSSYRWTGTIYAMVSNTLTAADIKSLYESNLDTNAFTDTEKTKLASQSGINTGDQDLSGKADVATTLAGYGITDAYTKTELNAVNVLRADKYLAAQNIANMIYTTGNLTKIQYNTATDVNYEVLTYGVDGLSNVAHYINSVLVGNTVLTYAAGDLVSAVFTGV